MAAAEAGAAEAGAAEAGAAEAAVLVEAEAVEVAGKSTHPPTYSTHRRQRPQHRRLKIVGSRLAVHVGHNQAESLVQTVEKHKAQPPPLPTMDRRHRQPPQPLAVTCPPSTRLQM